jgi:hypothetical protein
MITRQPGGRCMTGPAQGTDRFWLRPLSSWHWLPPLASLLVEQFTGDPGSFARAAGRRATVLRMGRMTPKSGQGSPQDCGISP